MCVLLFLICANYVLKELKHAHQGTFHVVFKFPVIHITWCYHKVEQFSLLITYKVELKAEISAFDMVNSRWYLRLVLLFIVYFPIWASKTLQKSSAIQKISVTLSSVIIAIIVCKLLIFSTLKLQQFSLITKFSDTYISSNSRYFTVIWI